MAIPIIDSEKCNGCGTCVESCPTETIVLENDVAKVNDPDECIECGMCAQECPEGAIEL